MPKFHAKDRRLERVKPKVSTDRAAVVLRLGAVPAEQAQASGEIRVVRRRQANVPEASEVFRGKEAEAPELADGACPSAAVFRADRLGGILDHHEAVLGG